MKKIFIFLGLVISFQFNFAQTETPRFVLLEGFTSSTCLPCLQGNRNLQNVLIQNAATDNFGRYVLVKYQMDWPGMGDPYFTHEAQTKKSYYAVGTVPMLQYDGKYSANTSNFSHNALIARQNTPANVEILIDFTLNGKTINAEVTVKPLVNIEGDNLKLFVAIIEKKTTKNKKNNGESEFSNVMKKFMPDAAGTSLGNLSANTPVTKSFSWTFKGDYRLPVDATPSNIINHDIEHSVENFENLRVAAWVQNMTTREVYNAGIYRKQDCPINYSVINGHGTLIGKSLDVDFQSGKSFPEDMPVSFTAVPDEHYKVKEWKNNGQTLPSNVTNSYSFFIDNATTISVEYEKINYNVYFDVIGGHGSIGATVDGKPIEVSSQHPAFTQVVFTAIPDPNYGVKKWMHNGVTHDITSPVFEAQVLGGLIVNVEFEPLSAISSFDNHGIDIFPNPCTDMVTITHAEKVQKITLTHVTGQVIDEKITQGESETIFIIKNLPRGVYFVTLKMNSGERVTKKIIK
jgi:hypothetical protein